MLSVGYGRGNKQRKASKFNGPGLILWVLGLSFERLRVKWLAIGCQTGKQLVIRAIVGYLNGIEWMEGALALWRFNLDCGGG